ncbi:MAG TPA: alpha/beta fold hydrolase [Planctomycetaceae bacterium]|jgi:pimeloyl-ACP methyl ester carboxylesterase|nr:alpha/beta fold hydrolase [Planctomycetaceae bacterium]
MKTLGGRQFWADVRFCRGWRIQRNVFTSNFRLLDAKDHRHAFGSLETCQGKLHEIRKSLGMTPMSGKAVIAIHGILRSPKTFALMRPALEKAGYTVVGFNYPSTRIPIGEVANDLKQVIESLDGIEEINFVVHSLGGLVTRAYLKHYGDPRIKRMVMLGVPNRGAELADLLRKNYAFRLIFGPAGQQLVTDQNGVIPTLPIPEFEFAVVAGGRGRGAGFNPLIPGDDDLLVAVASAQLPGAADSMTIRALHSFLPANAEVIDATVRFLQMGRLRKTGEPQPIPRETVEQRPSDVCR